ncbi:MAG: transporter substrate-binding domain-containing protein [Coriobacteriales bacterium]|nr:transporter substrate-binding domain-containing protein [Coriobacteriales bacterium]
MKKFVIALLASALLCLGVFALAGCGGGGGNDPAPAPAPAPSGDNGTAPAPTETYTLIVGFDADYPPYGFMAADGSYTGFDLDLAAEVCKSNGWEFKATPIDWNSKDALLNSGTINCIWNGFTYEDREDKYAWSAPYINNSQVVVVKATNTSIKDLNDLAGKNVLTQADSAALTVLQGDKADLTATFAKLETIGDYNNAFLQLQSGLVDAVACDASIAAYQMAANKDMYYVLPTELSSEHYAVGFKLGDDAHAAQVTKTLKEMYADGTVAQIAKKYEEYGLDINLWCLQ